MDFRAIIKEQAGELERIEREENIIERDGIEEAGKSLKHPNILAVMGIRRCGKSIFSYLLAKNSRMGYINFDDERLAGIKAEDLDKLLQSMYELHGDMDCIVLDEVQNIKDWELFANRLRWSKRLIITGSNSKLLSGDLASRLTGRYIDFMLFPFSFREFLRAKQFKESISYTTKERSEIIGLLREYLDVGGFPEAYKFGKSMVSRIYEGIVTKDILLRHRISKAEELKKLAHYLITNSSGEFTYSKLSRILGVKHILTVSKWVSYMESSFLVFKLDRFDFKLKQQFIAPKKIYCIDTGIINSVGFASSDSTGRLMENDVAVQLQRAKSLDNSLGVYYWRDYRQNEVDFVLKRGKAVIQLIQVTYAMGRDDIKDCEISALLKAGKELRCRNCLVITWDYEGKESFGRVKVTFIPLWKWLLEGAR